MKAIQAWARAWVLIPGVPAAALSGTGVTVNWRVTTSKRESR